MALPYLRSAVFSLFVLSLHRIGDDPRALQQAFEGFYRWDSIRAVIGMLEGFFEIWLLVALSFFGL